MSESRTVTALQAKKSLLKAFKVKRPLFLWGPPGIGKSELVEGIARELGGLMIDLRLGQMEPTDIRGIPFYNKDIGKMIGLLLWNCLMKKCPRTTPLWSCSWMNLIVPLLLSRVPPIS